MTDLVLSLILLSLSSNAQYVTIFSEDNTGATASRWTTSGTGSVTWSAPSPIDASTIRLKDDVSLTLKSTDVSGYTDVEAQLNIYIGTTQCALSIEYRENGGSWSPHWTATAISGNWAMPYTISFGANVQTVQIRVSRSNVQGSGSSYVDNFAINGKAPTNDPSKGPTNDPSKTPTNNPSKTPTNDPSIEPTIEPSIGPSNDPSEVPTSFTMIPTSASTTNLIITDESTTAAPTKRPTSLIANIKVTYSTNAKDTGVDGIAIETTLETSRDIKYDGVYNQSHSDIDSIYNVIISIIGGIFIIMAGIGYIDSKLLRTNDFYKIAATFCAMLQVFDLVSDVFLSIKISHDIHQSVFFDLFICSLICIIFPTLVAMGQLLRQIHRHWWRDDKIKLWLIANGRILFLLSIFTGSSFTAIEMMNSNLLQLQAFSMDLTNEQVTRFLIKRIYSIVILENLPQVILQAIYFREINDWNFIAVSSMAFSLISIFTTVTWIITAKQILNSQGYAIVEFDAIGPSIITKTEECRNQVTQIQNQISSMLGLSKRLVEVMRPQYIPNGLKLRAILHVNRITVRDIDYKKLLQDAEQNGQLNDIIKSCWDLKGNVMVSIIGFQVKESKKWIANTVSIKVYNHSIDNYNNQSPKQNQANLGDVELRELPLMPEINDTAGLSDVSESSSTIDGPDTTTFID